MALTRINLPLLILGIILVLFTREAAPRLRDGVPASLWAEMKNISTKDFVEKFLKKKLPDHAAGQPDGVSPGQPGQKPPPEIPGEGIIWNQEGSLIPGGSDVVSNMLEVEEDRCEIKLTSVPIPRHPDHNVIYWPSCVKLDQCSGCCNNEILQCVPTMVQGVEMQVMRARYPFSGADYFEFEGIHPMVFDRHVACECRCRMQIEDCNLNKHEYDPYSCACRCFNEYEATSCVQPQIWNNTECGCVCPTHGRACYNDESYDELTCSCVRNGGIEPFISEHTQGSIIPISGSSCDDPDLECRFGYTEQIVDGVCQCRVASHNVLEGSLINVHSPGTSRPQVLLPHVDTEPGDFDRVPGHPQFVTVPTTRRPRPTRRPRRPRGPRTRNVIRN